jgi:hypothetical protein
VSDEQLSGLDEQALRARVEEVRARMRPAEQQLASLRAERDVLLTELRRRERLATRERRAAARQAAAAGAATPIAELVSSGGPGSFDDYAYSLKTGGEVRLGFPGARAQTVAFTDGKQVAQARDLVAAAELYEAGWELGSPGRPGVRVHFPGTRLERLESPDEVFARPAEKPVEGSPK